MFILGRSWPFVFRLRPHHLVYELPFINMSLGQSTIMKEEHDLSEGCAERPGDLEK